MVCGSPDHPAPARPGARHVDRRAEEEALERHRRAEKAHRLVERRLDTLRERLTLAVEEAGETPVAELADEVAALETRYVDARRTAADAADARVHLDDHADGELQPREPDERDEDRDQGAGADAPGEVVERRELRRERRPEQGEQRERHAGEQRRQRDQRADPGEDVARAPVPPHPPVPVPRHHGALRSLNVLDIVNRRPIGRLSPRGDDPPHPPASAAAWRRMTPLRRLRPVMRRPP